MERKKRGERSEERERKKGERERERGRKNERERDGGVSGRKKEGDC